MFVLILTVALAAGVHAAQPASSAASHTRVPRPSATPTIRPTVTPTATPEGDAERGAELFGRGANGAPPCGTCHQTVRNAFGFALGPNLAGIGERAPERIEELAPEAYIAESVLEPHAYVVPGYRDIMYPSFAEHYDDQDIADLVAYLMTL
jgi:mono/diheme cytochrome c family protein